MPNLGAMLASNIKQEQLAATNAAAAEQQQRTEEAKRKFGIVREFFAEAREYFVTAITNHVPADKMYLQVGGKRFAALDVDCHDVVATTLDSYSHNNDDSGPKSLHDPKRYAALWAEFQAWALENGLIAKWQYAWDGGGMDSWWLLRVQPAPAGRR